MAADADTGRAWAMADLPRIEPMLATSARALPEGEGWVYELKWDGIRAVACVAGGEARFTSRNGNDLTGRWPHLQALAQSDQVAGHGLVLDGEVVAFDDDGRPSFSALQEAGPSTPIAYLVFDLLHVDGRTVTELPWHERRERLEGLGLTGPCWQTPSAHRGDGGALLAASRARRLEGVVAKRDDAPYVPGRRSRSWVKVKNVGRQELVVGGWLGGQGNRSGRIGALLVGYYTGDQRDREGLVFAGKVGTGFTQAELARLQRLLDERGRPESPFRDKVPHKGCHWVEPDLVAEVEFTEWTHLGTLRAPSYKGLRDDKPPGAVRREDPAPGAD